MQTKSFLSISAALFSAFVMVLFSNCNHKKSHSAVEFRDFNREIDSVSANGITTAEFASLKNKHGRFFILWLNEVLDFEKYGPLNDSLGAVYLSEFMIKNKPVFNAVSLHYKKYPQLQNQISDAIGNLQDLMGNAPKPVVYAYFSQFSNYNTFVDTFGGKTIFAFSAEMFMNDTFPLYEMLDVPEFFKRYDSTAQIPAMMIWTYLKSVYDVNGTSKNMVSEAVLNGKIWYTMAQVFPDANPWDIYGYTEKEWKQMVTEEGQIWKHYVDQNMLFQTDFNKYKRYFNYGNHTFGAGIPEDCPPLIGNFTGYRIVEQYMKKSGTKLADLWKLGDAEKILRESGYNPIK